MKCTAISIHPSFLLAPEPLNKLHLAIPALHPSCRLKSLLLVIWYNRHTLASSGNVEIVRDGARRHRPSFLSLYLKHRKLRFHVVTVSSCTRFALGHKITAPTRQSRNVCRYCKVEFSHTVRRQLGSVGTAPTLCYISYPLLLTALFLSPHTGVQCWLSADTGAFS